MAIAKRKLKGRKGVGYIVLLERERISGQKRGRQYVGCFRTKKEAESAERHALEERARGVDLVPGRVTFAELLNRWSEHRRTQNLSLKTLEEDEAKLKIHVRPHIGSVKLAKLRPMHLDSLYARLFECGRVSGKGGLSSKTVRHVHGIIGAALEYAVRKQLVPYNVARSASPPKLQKKEAGHLSPEQATQMIAGAAKRRLECLAVVAFSTGARRGELLGLKWASIDFERSSVWIRLSLAETRGRVLAEKPTKTHRTRMLKLSPLAVRALQKQHAAQAAEKLAAGAAYEDRGYVFADPLGGPLVPSFVSDQFRKIARDAGIGTHLHETRHTAGTWMLADGIDIATVSTILGHSNRSTTVDIYGHAIFSAQAGAVATIEDRLRKAKSD